MTTVTLVAAQTGPPAQGTKYFLALSDPLLRSTYVDRQSPQPGRVIELINRILRIKNSLLRCFHLCCDLTSKGNQQLGRKFDRHPARLIINTSAYHGSQPTACWRWICLNGIF